MEADRWLGKIHVRWITLRQTGVESREKEREHEVKARTSHFLLSIPSHMVASRLTHSVCLFRVESSSIIRTAKSSHLPSTPLICLDLVEASKPRGAMRPCTDSSSNSSSSPPQPRRVQCSVLIAGRGPVSPRQAGSPAILAAS